MDAPRDLEAAAGVTPDAPGRVTPMMEQYIEIKAANPDSLLFYRMGDFYELFFGDAETASQALGIVLTKRGKHLGRDIPMCGVPVERADDYLHKLIALGHRVAVCEQTEDPAEARKRGAKSVVRRDVVRLVTPGTLTEDSLLEARANNFLLALARSRGSEADADRYGLAWLDLSTGEFHVTECGGDGLASSLSRIAPTETLVAERPADADPLAEILRGLPALTPVTRDVFESGTAERRLAGFFGVASTAGFGALSRLELGAAAACVTYVERTQVGKRPALSPPRRETSGATLLIDPATRLNLELVRTLAGERRGSLLAAIDRNITSAGARLLAQRLAAPMTDLAAIGARHDAVAAFVGDGVAREALRAVLKSAPDMARPLSRLSLGRGGPRDLAAIRDGLAAAREGAAVIARLADAAAEIAAAHRALCAPDDALARELGAALADELPLSRRDGGFVRGGYAAALDELRGLRDESRRVVAAMQSRYADDTGVRTLKIRHNNVLGYFVEVTAQHVEKLLAPPLNANFIHRQTLAGQVRFTTTELAETEAKIASAGEKALALELELFDALLARVMAQQAQVKAAADAFAALDVAAALATLAVERDYVRPEMDEGTDFLIEAGRHPVVEQFTDRMAGPFVANGCDLSPTAGAAGGQLCLLTGPNMAGKSTYLRQNALIAVLAQAGSFVPAKRARIGIVDRLFSRVGAADDIARGRSTFMVEMVETAAILNQAGARALVILDEIGRGTATFDGLSIAWATIEHLHDTNRCRAMFATHYHELTALSARLPRLFNATMRVKEWRGEVGFLHEVVPGAADRSYGIQVARLAGLPAGVIRRAREVLAELEADDRGRPRQAGFDELPLFAAQPPAPEEVEEPDALREALEKLDPDALSPRAALEAVYALRRLLKPLA